MTECNLCFVVGDVYYSCLAEVVFAEDDGTYC